MSERRSRRRITDAQWFAARAVSEGAPATRVRVAAMLGCDASVVYARAALEGWTRLDFRTAVAVEAHRDFIERVASQAGEGGFDGASAPGAPQNGDAGPDCAEEAGQADDAAAAGQAGVPGGADGLPGEKDDPLALLARAARVLARRLAELVGRAEAGGRLNKVEIDGLLALARMTERWETLAKERAKEEETQSDEEIARTLRIVDRRILELARAEAARLVEAGSRTEGGEAGAG